VDDVRAELARKEAGEYRQQAHAAVFILLGIYAVVLGAMAFFHAGVEWLLVVGFLFGTLVICQTVIDGIARLDAGRGYLEQMCHDMNERIVRIHLQMPS
jgi:uncharacterized membrane protein HdeD (DUF308 family)